MKTLKKLLPPISAAMSAACLLLLLADLIWPDVSLFLKNPVKWFLLACSVSVIAGSAALIDRERRQVRRRQQKRRGAQRR